MSDLSPSVEQHRAERRAFLLALYELSNADTMMLVSEADLARHLGLGAEASDRIARAVVDQGLAEWKTKGGNMGITAYGVEVAEAELSPPPMQGTEPQEPSTHQAMISILQEYLDLIDASFIGDETGLIQGVDPGLDDRLRKRLPFIRRILEEIEPGLGEDLYPSGSDWPWTGVRRVVLDAIGRLEVRQEEEGLLGLRGPKLAAEGLHQWVWGAAAKLWDDGYRREAIQKAATQVESELKKKLGRHDLSGSKLFEQAFALSAPAIGQPRLRIPGFPAESESYRNLHLGAKDFGSGCMAAIRNIVTHEPTEPGQDMALEQLAALSVLARWIDASVVDTGQP